MVQPFFFLSVDGEPITRGGVAFDPFVFAALYIGGLHKQLFSLQVLDPAYTWTRKVVETFKLMVEYMVNKCCKLGLVTKHDKWMSCGDALRLMKQDMRAPSFNEAPVHNK